MISDIKYGLFKYDVQDYYAILGTPIDANAKEIRLRYHEIARQLHPDTSPFSESQYKQQASQILSKLVNPAYENLYKDKSRRECQLILTEMGRKLASDTSQITLVTDTAKKLYSNNQGKEKLYKELIEKLAPNLYDDLDKILTKIALISELNMVYIMSQEEIELGSVGESKPKYATNKTSPVTGSSSTDSNQTNSGDHLNSNPQEESFSSFTSRLSKLIHNAQQRQEEGNIEQAILDLREALKIDPSNSTCHALIGSCYLQQGNMTYGRIHINKAIELNPNDQLVKQSQQKLKEVESKDSKKSSKYNDSKAQKSSQKSKDNKQKKEAPKIFGIPLW